MYKQRPYKPNVPSVTGKFVPERLVDFKYARSGEKYYLVKWCGFPPEENTWEPRSNLTCFFMMKKIERETAQSGDPEVPIVIPGKRKQRRGFIPFERRITGFDLGRTPEMILGARVKDGQLEFLIKWKGVDEADMIPREIANERCPQIVIAFYQEKLFWKAPDSCCDEKKAPDQRCGEKQAPDQRCGEKKAPDHCSGQKFAANGEKYYLVKWSGFPPEENTWEPRYNLSCHFLMDIIERKKAKSEEPGVPIVIPGRRQQQPQRRGFVPFEKRITGFDLGRTPEMVLGMCAKDGQLEFLIKWKGVEEADLIPRKIAYTRCPQIVIEFYHKQLFKKPHKHGSGKKKARHHRRGKK